MADMLFGRFADARRARLRRLRLFSAHLDEYLSEKDVKSRFRFGRDSINYLADLLSDDLARNTARNHALSPLGQGGSCSLTFLRVSDRWRKVKSLSIALEL